MRREAEQWYLEALNSCIVSDPDPDVRAKIFSLDEQVWWTFLRRISPTDRDRLCARWATDMYTGCRAAADKVALFDNFTRPPPLF